MKKFITITAMMFFIVSLLFTSGCNSTRLISSWKSPDSMDKDYNKILVLGLMHAKYREIKESTEDALVKTLMENGVNAAAAYKEYSPKAFEDLKEGEAVAKIKDHGYDAVLVIALLDRAKEKEYTPGNIAYRPFTYYNYFWGYYRTVWGRIYEPGYYSETTSYILEANLYDLNSKALEYSAQTKTFNPSSAKSLGADLGKTIVMDMKAKGMVQ